MTEELIINMKGKIYRNLDIDTLVKKAVERKEGIISKNGALSVHTGKYNGRSPDDRFIVDTPSVHDRIHWGKANRPISEKDFNRLYDTIAQHLRQKDELFVLDGMAGAGHEHSMNIRVINELASQNLCIRHMLRRIDSTQLEGFEPDFTILSAPGCHADPLIHNVNSEAFIIINLEKKIALIGGTSYFGEIKKAVFSIMNYFLPEKGILTIHGSANKDEAGNTALFLGLSGTGKTSLSVDGKRILIGDDEHAWSPNGIFNIEGGCYAKCIRLSKEKEPVIYGAIRHGAVVENVVIDANTLEFDFNSELHTENTRVTYPIEHLEKAEPDGTGSHPKTIIFLTADAFGVMPPVARLTKKQAIYHFLSGYTSKLAGTERGIINPVATFSTLFGEPFMPLDPKVYAGLLDEYLTNYGAEVYLINTGWIGGPYGIGKRIDITHSRAIVDAALNGDLKNAEYARDDIFNLWIPKTCRGVDEAILNPKNTWKDKSAYEEKAIELASLFSRNFARFSDIPEDIRSAGPNPPVKQPA
ncbi:MAG: phosphoenolpyruvate carboxykinase (ATP) [archaeon]